jgi:two-component system response regulator
VVVLTSSTEPGDLKMAYRLGANSYVRKPSTLRDLVPTVRQITGYWLQLNQAPRGTREPDQSAGLSV